jgi:hypothetical protein
MSRNVGPALLLRGLLQSRLNDRLSAELGPAHPDDDFTGQLAEITVGRSAA